MKITGNDEALERKLSPSEYREHWIRLPRTCAQRLTAGSVIEVTANGNALKMRVDSWGRLFPLKDWQELSRMLGLKGEDVLLFFFKEGKLCIYRRK